MAVDTHLALQDAARAPKVRLIVKSPDETTLATGESEEDVDNNEPQSRSRRIFCPDEYRKEIEDMMEQHYCAHPLIPGYSSPTPDGIREWAAREAYHFCIERDLPEVWAYLYGNWYRDGRWSLWARSAHSEIPVLKTTMMVESQ